MTVYLAYLTLKDRRTISIVWMVKYDILKICICIFVYRFTRRKYLCLLVCAEMRDRKHGNVLTKGLYELINSHNKTFSSLTIHMYIQGQSPLQKSTTV